MENTVKESRTPIFRILMFPWLAHGHISPFLELSKKLSKKGDFKIYFCSTEINLKFIKKNLADDHYPIDLVQLHLPELPELPPHYHTTKNLPPHLSSTLMRAFQSSKLGFSDILNTLKPDLLIYDGFQSWAPELAALNQIPSVFFLVVGAVNLSFVCHSIKRGVSSSNERYPFPEIFHRDYEIKKLMAMSQISDDTGLEENFTSKSFEQSCDIVLIKSWRGIEGKYLDHLSSMFGKEMVTLGPLVDQETSHTTKKSDEEEEKNHAHILEFLNNKDDSSVVYVSFGSEYFLSKDEREEIAHGLELSNANFIWVVRFPVGHTISMDEALPKSFLDRVKGRGMVVDGWAPQAKILEHPSIGGFVSHCGWGSFIESLYYGVPLMAIPMQLDQPLHARLSVEVGFGIEILKDENGQINREEVAKIIRMVVVEKKVEELRGKARELGKKLREEGEEEMHEAIEKLRNLCIKNKELAQTAP